MHAPRNTPVLISGVGIAGPALAYWLIARGFQPTLIERSLHLRAGGYVIDFWGLGYDVAEKMELVPHLEREGYVVTELRIVDSRGHRVGGFDANVFRTLTGGRYVTLRRSDLSRLIFDRIADKCEIIFGDSITAIDQENDGVHVGFEHRQPQRYDLVIGCDGLHSALRDLVFGSQDRYECYLGYIVAAFDAAGYRPRDENVYVSYSVPGKQVARFAMRDDRTMFLFVFASPSSLSTDPHDIRTQRAVLHREFDQIGWECPQILAALDETDDLYFDRVSQIRMDNWYRGRVALLGDSAFCPSLVAGQGAALAMTAAYILAGELAKSAPTPEEGFVNYESVLRSFMMEKQKAAESFAASFVPRTQFGLFLRNQMTKAFRKPLIAKLVLGNTLLDRLELPTYTATLK